MRKILLGIVTIVAWLLHASVSFAATDWSTQDYDLYPGDFDGDGKTDLLYVARDASKASGIARSDGSGPNIPYQSWPSNHLGIPWHGNVYGVVVADFNNDDKDDVFLQRSTAGDSFLLLTDANGKISGISQTVANTALGLTWSADQHKLLAGDFNGDGRADLFLQARNSAGNNAIVAADANGQFLTGPLQTWTDSSWSAFKWSSTNSNIFVGDFNGDGRADLLIQARPKIVLVDYEIPIPVPTYPPNSNGVVLAQAGATPFIQAGVQQWSRIANGVDWSPLTATVVVGDFNGDGRTDVILQARYASGPSYLLTGNAGGAALGTGTALATNVTWASDSYRLIAGNFDGTGGAGIYYQAVSGAGTNSYANTVTGGSVSTTTHNPNTATGVLPTSAVGSTVGSFAVSDSGYATYSVPISVPPGVAGVQPGLALTYSSGSGNGPLGIGWRLSGFSEISRCNKTIAQDNSTDAVLLTMSDRFCLDGNKLRLTSGVYGAASSTYQTELETFAKVTAAGSAGNGPASFTVIAKDGMTYEYGGTTDSRVESLNPSASTTVRTWALNKVSDRAGNFMTITYEEDGAPNGGFRPVTVTYTANTAPNPDLDAAYKVVLTWDTRPATDQYIGYVAGGVVRETKRLNRIETQYNDPAVGSWRLVRKYQLSYNTSGVTARSRLAAIQECDRDAKCLAPTTIAWQEGTFGWSATEITSSTLLASAVNGLPIDMNGDGRDDYAYFDSSTNYWRVMFANSDGTYQTPVNAYAGSASTYQQAIPIDVNGDGRRDLLVPNPSDSKWWWVRHDSASSFSSSATTMLYTTPGSSGAFAADVDGNGLDDVVSASSGTIYVAFNSSSATTAIFAAPTTAWTVPANSTYWSFGGAGDFGNSNVHAADFNGDGRNDVLVLTREDTTGGEPGVPPHYLYAWHVLQSAGSTFIEVATIISSTIAPSRPLLTDLNADGLIDVVYKKLNTSTSITTWRVRLANGTLAAETDTGVTAYGPGAIADCDGDGHPDLVAYGDGIGSTFICLKSDGAALATTAISLGSAGGTKVADVNGDGLPDFIGLDGGNVMKMRLHRGVITDFVASIADGFGTTVSVKYAPLTDASIYTKGVGAVFPDVDLQAPMYVVKEYVASDGIGGTYAVTQSYSGARMNVQGRGFLGFAGRSSIDTRSGIKSTSSFVQIFPHIGFAAVASTYQSASGPLITRVTSAPGVLVTDNTAFNDRKFPYASQSVQESYEVGGTGNSLAIAQVTQTTTLNSYGDPTNITTVTADQTGSGLSYTTSTTNTYATADLGNWCLSFIDLQEVQSTVPVYGAQTRTVDYVKDTANPSQCRVLQEIVEPSDNAVKVTTAFTHDVLGHANLQTVSALDVPARTTTVDFGTRGVFPMSITNAEGKTTVNTFDFALGVPLLSTDPNQLQVSMDYDGFGRLTKVTRPDGTQTALTFNACTVGNGYCGDSRLRYQVETQELDTSYGVIRSARQLFDAHGRSLYDQAQTLSGAFTTIATNYDNQGRLYQRSQPYFAGYPVYFTTVSYDLIGRPTQEERRVSETDSGLQKNKYEYNRLTRVLTDAKDKVTTQVRDAIGQVVQVTDPGTGVTQYQYDSFGNLKKTIDPSLNEIVNTFNIRGFKTSTHDPDMGTWGYTHYPTGELHTQTNAKGQTATFTYDVLSRLKTRVEPEGTTTLNYGASAPSHNIGRLVSIDCPGMVTLPATTCESFVYDNFGRLQDATTNVDTSSFVVSSTYSATTGLLETTTYPTSTSAVAGSRFKVTYEYANGLLQRTRDFNSPSTIYWEQIATNAAGQAIDELYGNGLHTYSTYDGITGLLGTRTAGATSQVQYLAYQWDQVGNLTQRKDQRIPASTLTEDFTYDNLHRLSQSKLNTVTNLDVGYNVLGNISSKTGLGTYSYPASSSSSVRPHGVTGIGANTYGYDNGSSGDGNMTSRAGGALTWYSYDKPSSINKGSSSSQFFYGPDRARFKQVAVTAAGGSLPVGTETTIYVAGGMFEKVTKPSGVVEYKHYVMGGSEAVAIRTLRSNSINDTRYLHKDHLGSLDTVTDESGSVVLRLSYDAFGNRRSATSWSGSPSAGDWTSIAAITHRGFTFHEHIDNVEVIHMNGRVYDSNLGRFLSADPFVQAPGFSQSFNRYSYTFNNPLSYMDPSGYGSQSPDDSQDSNGVLDNLSRLNNWINGLLPTGRIANYVTSVGVRVHNNRMAHLHWQRPYVRAIQTDGFVQGGRIAAGGTSTVSGADDLQSGYVFSFQPIGMRTGIIDYDLRATRACELQHSCGEANGLFDDILLAILPFGRPVGSSFSRLAVAGGLGAHEGILGGHTLARHVNVGSLAQRLLDEPLIPAASRFASREIAELSVGTALDVNQSLIRSWLQSSSGSLAISHRFVAPIGETLMRGATGVTPASSVTVILRRYPGFPEGFRIHTAFPGM